MCVNKHTHDIKLVDFGLARQLSGEEAVKSSFGTPDFVGKFCGPPMPFFSVWNPASIVCHTGVSNHTIDYSDDVLGQV